MRLNSNTCNVRIVDLIFLLILCSLWEYASGKGCENKVRQNSFLWKVKRDPPAYFFGTLHVPYTKVWDQIPAASKRAFRGSDNVYFELDLTNKRTRTALTRCQMLPGGADLRQVLPNDLYRRLKQHLDYVKRAMPGWLTSEQAGKGWYADNLFEAIAGNWERKRPVWVMLMVNSLTEDDIRSQGVPVLDLHLASQAGRMGKKVGAIEQVDEQCQPLNGLNMSQVLYALDHTLSIQERVRFGTVTAPYTKEDLIAQYNCGDLDAAIFDSDSSQIPKLVNGSEGAISQEEQNMSDQVDWYFRNELIYRRNKKMAQRVERLLQNNPDQSFFFAFGAGHFLGNGSVIDFLEKAGFEIEHSAEVELATSRKRKRAQDRQRKGKSRRRHRNKSRQNNKKSKNKYRNEGSPAAPSVRFPVESEPAFIDSGLPRVRVVNRYPTVAPLLHHNDDWRHAVSRLDRLRREKIESESSRGYVWRRASPESEDSWSLRYKKLILNSGGGSTMTQTANGLAMTVVALIASLLRTFVNC